MTSDGIRTGRESQRSSARRLWARLVFHGLAAVTAAAFVLPVVWMVSVSLYPPGTPLPRTLAWRADPLAWRSYARLVEMLPLGRYAFNSLLVAGLAVLISLLTASWAGFALAQLRTRQRRWIVLLSLAVLMVPLTALWLPRFALFTWLGMTNTYGALLAPALMGTSPLFVLLFYWTFRRVPREMFESAQLDGAGALATWRLVALPAARPALVVVGVLTFLFYWSDFVHPLLYLKSQDLYTLPVGLRQLQQLDRANGPVLMAGAVVMTALPVLMFLAAQYHLFHERWFPDIEVQ